MKKIIILIWMLVIILDTNTDSYAQTGKGPSPNSAPLITSSTYRITPWQFEQDSSLLSSPLSKGIDNRDEYADSPLNKIGNGVINTTTSWIEIPHQMTEMSEKYNLLAGCTLGFGKGLVSSFTRGVSGIFDVATFSFPPYDKPLMEPEYKVDHPEEGFKIILLDW